LMPLTERLVRPVTVSDAASPKTALPLMVRLLVPPPLTFPLNVVVEAVSVAPVPTVTAPVYDCVPLVVMVLVLIVVAPLTDRLVSPVTVSAGASPKTALPLIARLLAPPPLIVPLKVAVEAVRVVPAASVTLPLYVCMPLVEIAPAFNAIAAAVTSRLVN